MSPIRFGFAGKWSPQFNDVQQAAYLVKANPVPVGVEVYAANPWMPAQYRVVTHQDYWMAAQNGRVIWTALA